MSEFDSATNNKCVYFLSIHQKGKYCSESSYMLGFTTAQFMALISRSQVGSNPECFTFIYDLPSDDCVVPPDDCVVPHKTKITVELRSTRDLLRWDKLRLPIATGGLHVLQDGSSLHFEDHSLVNRYKLRKVIMPLPNFGRVPQLRQEWYAFHANQASRKRARDDAIATGLEQNVILPLRKRIKALKKELEDCQRGKYVLQAKVRSTRNQSSEVEVVAVGGRACVTRKACK